MNSILFIVSATLLAFLNPSEVQSSIPTVLEIETAVHDWKLPEAISFLEKCPLEMIQSNGERLMKLAVLRYIPSRGWEFKEETTWETRLLKPLIERFGLQMTEGHLKTSAYAWSDKQLFLDMLENGAPMTPAYMEHSLWRGDLATTCAKYTGIVDYVEPASGRTMLMALCQSEWHQKYAFELLELGANPSLKIAPGGSPRTEHAVLKPEPGVTAAELLIPRYGVFSGDADSKPNLELLIALVQYGFKFEDIPTERYSYYGETLELIAALPGLLKEAEAEIGHENPTKEEIRKKVLEIINSD